MLELIHLSVELSAPKIFFLPYLLSFPLVFLPSFQTILKGVESVDADVEAIWLEALLRATECLPDEVVADDILSLAVAKGAQSNNKVGDAETECPIIP